jgi:uncharacterized membrane protein
MGEPESLDTAEPLPERIERHGFDRLIMLSDGVFAIAITLAALELRPQGSFTDLAGLWATMRAPLYSYMVSFAVVSAYWASHRDVFARLRRVDGGVTLLTLLLLFLVALLPITTRMLYEVGLPQGPTTQFYCLVLTAIGSVQFLLWTYVACRPGLIDAGVRWRYRVGRIALAAAMAVFFAFIAAGAGRAQTGSSYLLLLGAAGVVAVGRRLFTRYLSRERR